MEPSIIQRLGDIENVFLSAADDGPLALQRLADRWSQLQTDIEQAMKTNSLDTATLSRALAAASGVSILAERLADLEKTFSFLSSKLQDSVDGIFTEVCFTQALNFLGTHSLFRHP